MDEVGGEGVARGGGRESDEAEPGAHGEVEELRRSVWDGKKSSLVWAEGRGDGRRLTRMSLEQCCMVEQATSTTAGMTVRAMATSHVGDGGAWRHEVLVLRGRGPGAEWRRAINR